MTREKYMFLFEKYMAGKATPEEVDILLKYKDGFELDNHENDSLTDEPGQRIQQKLDYSILYRKTRPAIKTWLSIAATLTVLVTIAIISRSRLSETNVTAGQAATQKHINEAILTLPDGKQIALNQVKMGTTLKHGSISVKKQNNGIMQFSVQAGNATAATESNTVSTPAGSQYQVILPDGSKIWLNAMSSLKFPTVFTGGQRKVKLSGEAYFEVAKNKKLPFKVEFNNQEVEVLGTHFNIMAYQNETTTRTTLLEGSVRIRGNNVSKILTPGNQAVINGNQSQIEVLPANTDAAVAWKNGMFIFYNENIKTIMAQLARWYDVDVYYQGNIQDKEYGIRISKSKNLTEILKNLELTGTIHFKTEGRRVTVME